MLAVEVSPNGDHLSVAFGGASPVRLHALWLRDACSCAGCRRPSTNERLVDAVQLPDDLILRGSVIAGQDLLGRPRGPHRCRLAS